VIALDALFSLIKLRFKRIASILFDSTSGPGTRFSTIQLSNRIFAITGLEINPQSRKTERRCSAFDAEGNQNVEIIEPAHDPETPRRASDRQFA
jgi:hypothetical protein